MDIYGPPWISMEIQTNQSTSIEFHLNPGISDPHFAKEMGGEIEAFHQFVHWKYFPHVGSEEMNNGFYEQLEHMQGKKHTYYAGEILNFSCVGFTCEYAQHIVNRYF